MDFAPLRLPLERRIQESVSRRIFFPEFEFEIDKLIKGTLKLKASGRETNIPTWIVKQTLAVLVNNFLIFGGAATVAITVLVYLTFFTSYWWVAALYAAWYLYDLNSDENGGWDYRRVECTVRRIRYEYRVSQQLVDWVDLNHA